MKENKVDILFLQETFVDNNYLTKAIENTLGLNNKIIWNFGKAKSCCVAILLINENIRIENFPLDLLGRIIRLDFTADGFSNFRFVNAYFPTDTSERLEFSSTYLEQKILFLEATLILFLIQT